MLTLRDRIKRTEKKAADLFAEAEKNKYEGILVENITSLQKATKPVLDAQTFETVMAGVSSLRNADKWAQWGFRSGNSVLLMLGPPGTGKTTTARWLAKFLGNPLIPVSMGDIGGSAPGDTERALVRIFECGREKKAVVFFDECDALLWDRSKAGADSMWMLGVINTILVQIEKYPYLVILSTNHPEYLDKALSRRVTFKITFAQPSFETRKKLWHNKWPTWPLALSNKAIKELAEFQLNGSSIEQAIKETARFAILQGVEPTYQKLRETCSRLAAEDASDSRGTRERS